MKIYQDFCRSITKQLFDIIDQQGSLLKWQKNWDSQGCNKLPVGSNGLYKGGNLFGLLTTQWGMGFNSNQWLTFNQIKKLGGSVRIGSRSQPVYFWKMRELETSATDEKKAKKIPIFRTYKVFNLEQTTLSATVLPFPDFQIKTIEELINLLGVTVAHLGGCAYYHLKDDIIFLPNPDRFNSRENYYATLLHELVHWTAGREDRLPRECFKRYQYDNKARAEEELVAEIGSVLLTAHFGIRGELEGHASYIQSWKQELNEKEVLRAIHRAGKAFEWIVNQKEDDAG